MSQLASPSTRPPSHTTCVSSCAVASDHLASISCPSAAAKTHCSRLCHKQRRHAAQPHAHRGSHLSTHTLALHSSSRCSRRSSAPDPTQRGLEWWPLHSGTPLDRSLFSGRIGKDRLHLDCRAARPDEPPLCCLRGSCRVGPGDDALTRRPFSSSRPLVASCVFRRAHLPPDSPLCTASLQRRWCNHRAGKTCISYPPRDLVRRLRQLH